MTYLTLNFEPDVTEITLKTHMGKVHKINVPETMMNSKKIKIMSGDLQTNAEVVKSELQNEIIQDLEVTNMLPSIEEARRMIEKNTTAEPAPQDYESRESGVPSLEEIRKRL